MSKIQLKITIPESLDDITLEQYQKYVKVMSKLDKDSDGAAEFANLKALEIFCGLELKESYKIPLHTFDAVLEQLALVLSQDTPLKKRFWFRGSNGVEVEYGMHPNLNDMTSGEYFDLDKYLNNFEDMHKAMAILFRPIVKKHKDLYQIEDYQGSDKYAEYMKYMPASVAIGARVFFYRLGMKLSKHTIASSLQGLKPQELSQVESKFSEANGVGIHQFMHSLEEMSQSLTKLPGLTYTNV